MTYDRKVLKAHPDNLAGQALMESGDFMKTKISNPSTILKTHAQGGELWQYKIGETVEGWNSDMNFDVATNNWQEGLSAFGGGGRGNWRTEWDCNDCELYLRKIVNIPEGDLRFTMFWDDGYDFYINGILASSKPMDNWVDNHVSITISDDAKAAIKYGEDNLFAIRAIQHNGGAYMDLGVMAYKDPLDITYVPEPVDTIWKDIKNYQDWLDIQNDLSGFYRVTTDIDLDMQYTPIGSTEAPFTGYIDGQNHTVFCPAIQGNLDRIGLFGYADGAHFVNLRLVDGELGGGADVGVLLGRGKGIRVEHVVFDHFNPAYALGAYGRDHVGIVAGMLEGGKLSTIKDVYVVKGNVTSSEYQAAGLVGIICDTRIINSYFTGTVSITDQNRGTKNNADASGIASRTEGGHSALFGVMSLADSIASASGNEFISYNGGGVIVIDSATCFVRDDMRLDTLFDKNRGGQFARASESMKRPLEAFKSYELYLNEGWDMVTVWGIPKGGGFPIFRYLGSDEDFEPVTSIPTVKKENNDLKVYSVDGNVVLETLRPTSVWIYNLQGVLVERVDIEGTRTIALPGGLYIVKSAQEGDVKAVKVLN
jgi:hypothetical protein